LSVRARKLNDLNHSKCPNRPSQAKSMFFTIF
jgi:hypothetical protein